MSAFEFWLTDDGGKRMFLLNPAFASYSRTIQGYGAFQIGVPYDDFRKSSPTHLFQRDWRVDVWMQPAEDVLFRREGSFLLRKAEVYQREDGVKIIMFYGRSPLDILRRRIVADDIASNYQKTGYIDNMMKEVVNTWFVAGYNVPVGEFAIDPNVGLGPSVTHEFPNKVVLDVLNDLKETSLTLYDLNGTKRIYFDVVEDDSLVANGFGYRFRTYADLRGVDRTQGMVFSPENGNINKAYYYEDYLDEANSVVVYADGYDGVAEDATQVNASRWNRIDLRSFGVNDANANVTNANALLRQNAGKIFFNADILSTPGSVAQPRCLYRVDWDLGDLLPVQFAGKNINAMVSIVYVSVDENGKEDVLARTVVGE